jgi:hypothetical protein
MQRDYILREIEKLGEFMAGLRRRLLGGGQEDELARVRDDLHGFARRAGIDPTILRSMSPDTLAIVVQGRAGADAPTCWLWAEFLYTDGLHARAEGDDDSARNRFSKALMLYNFVNTPLAGAWLGEVPARIEEIEDLLAS